MHALKGKKQRPEHIRQRAKALKRRWAVYPKKGHPHTQAAKRKMSESKKGHKHSAETRRKLAKAWNYDKHVTQKVLYALRGKPDSSNPAWKGGSEKYWKRKLIKVIGHKCQICGFTFVIHAHHIKAIAGRYRYGQNNHLHVNNLVLLCPNHHAMVHRKLITTDQLIRLIKGKTKA